jgi:perosamine synthetase
MILDHNSRNVLHQNKPSRRSFPFRHLPPTAIRVEGQDLWQGFVSLFQSQKPHETFRKAVMEYTHCSNCFLVSSGRAALTLIWLALKKLSTRKRVILPAYSCPTVVQSILLAGLTPDFCDVLPANLGFDIPMLRGLINEDVLAIVPTYLYGYAQDITDILDLAHSRNIYVIEDAAQAFGASFNGVMVGTLGEAGIYSMGRGKCIPTGHGGIIVAKQALSQAIIETSRELGFSIPRFDVTTFLLFMAYSIATHPFGWWFVCRSPLNPAHEGMNIHSLPPIHLGTLSAVQSAIGHSILKRLEEIQETRLKNALRLIDLLEKFDFISIPEIHPKAKPVFLRLPIITKDEHLAEKLFQMLWKEGIGVSKSYYRTLPDLYKQTLLLDSEVKYPGAEFLANCLLTLPTHAYLEEIDFVNISRVLDQL